MTDAGPLVWTAVTERLARRYGRVLEQHGCRPVWIPVTRLEPPRDPKKLAAALRTREHDVVLLTSANATAYLDPALTEGWSAVCVGLHTARAAREAGFDVVLVGRAGARAIADQMLREAPAIERVLFLRGRHALDITTKRLRAAARTVHEVVAYALEPHPDLARHVAEAPRPDAVLVGSPRAGDLLLEALGGAFGDRLQGARFIAMGATTATHLEELGAADVRVSERPGPEGVAALVS